MRYLPKLTTILLLAGCYLAQTASAQTASGAASAPADEKGRPFITNYHPSEYGASVQNWAVVQDDRGVMYVGNNSGVLEYDGATWRLIEVPKRTVIRSMAKAPDGRIYVGAVGDLGYLAPDSLGQMAFVSLLAAVPEEYRDFADVWNTDVIGGDVYFNVSQYVFRWDGEAMRVWPAEVDFHLGRAVDDTYYVRQWDVGLMRLEGEALRLVPGGERFAEERVYVMLPFGDGRVLLGTRTQGLFLFDPAAASGEAALTPFETEAAAALQQAGIYLPGAVLPGGRFALGTFSEGVYVVDRGGRLVRHIDRTAGLQDDVVLYTYVDRDGALWLGLDNGLARVEVDAPLSYYGAADGLTSNVLSLERHGGALYAGTSTGLFRLDPSQGRFREVAGAGIQVFDLLSVEGDLLLASFDGLQRLDGESTRFIQRSESGAFVSNRLHRSKQDPSRVFVSATGNGLTAVRRAAAGTWVVEGVVPGTNVEFWSIAEPEPGTLWLGTSANGVLRVRFPQMDGASPLGAAEVTTYGPEHGLPSSSVQVAAVGERLFFLTKDGLFRFELEAERFVRDSTTFAGVRTGGDPEEWTVLEDDQGRVWVNFGRETAVAYPQPDSTYRVETAPFRRFAGTASAAVYPEADGAVWLGFMERLVRLDLGEAAEEAAAFSALLRRVSTAEGRLLYGGAGTSPRVALPFEERALRFEYAAPRFVEAGRTEYRVMLDGFDTQPSAWTREAAKEYTNLPPGAYTFRVRARDVSGAESAEAAAYVFRVLPPWYRTWGAYTLYGLLFAAGVFAVDRIQRRRLIRRERERANREAETLRAEAAEAWANYLQSENQRQTQELEQARALQLSMLPQKLPEHPTVEIAAHMQTATEVGGDYYDFQLADDGTLTFAIGDATGHGLAAGTMVTAMKSLWNAFSAEPDLEQVMRKSSEALKGMHLPKLYMALAFGRLRGETLELVGAGMPPAWVYRAENGSVEAVPLKGLPLGSPGTFGYRRRRLPLAAGDTVVLMSDGFPELRNGSGEMLGYERVPEVVAEAAGGSAEEVLAHLKQTISRLCGGQAPDDDVTLVVLRARPVAEVIVGRDGQSEPEARAEAL